MGKIRVKTFGDEASEEAEKQKKAVKNAEKKARLSATEVADDGGQVREETSVEQNPESTSNDSQDQSITEDPKTPEKIESSSGGSAAVKPKKSKFIKTKQRSTKYKSALLGIDKNKAYTLSEALELLRKVKLSKFDETVELHINTTEAGISGQVKLPHGTGKEIRVAIATDEVLADVEKGKINFDILIAEPVMMVKLAKVAKVLGPRGLMPNPKNGTISDNPKEAMKKFQGGQINFKTESKIPVMHLSVGKTSFEDNELSENIKTLIGVVKKARIRNITLKSTMSPGIKLQV